MRILFAEVYDMSYSSMVDTKEVTPLLTINEAAEYLHVHDNTLRRWSDAGLILSYRIGSRGDRRFWHEDLRHFLADYNNKTARQ